MKKYTSTLLCGILGALSFAAFVSWMALGMVVGLRAHCLGASDSEIFFSKLMLIISVLSFFGTLYSFVVVSINCFVDQKHPFQQLAKNILIVVITFFASVQIFIPLNKFILDTFIETDSIYEERGDCQL